MNDFNVCLIVPYYYKQTQHQKVCIMKIKGPFVKLNNVRHNTCLTLKVICSNQNSKSKDQMVQFRFFNIHINHVMEYVFGSNNGLLTLNMRVANKAFNYNLMWRFEDKITQKHAFHHPWCNQYSECLRLLGKKYKTFIFVEMGGNCMVEKYLMKLNSRILKIFSKHVLKWHRYYDIIHETIYMKTCNDYQNFYCWYWLKWK